MGFTPATGQEISMGCVYEAFGLAPFPGANIGLNSTLGVNRQPPQAVGVSAIPLNSETELSVDMGGLDTIDEYCDIPTPTNTPTNTATPTNTPTNTPTPTPSSTLPACNVYEYINTTQNTTFSFGPYPLCPGPGDFDIQIAPGAEGVTFCIEQLSQGTIDAFNAQGLTLTAGECFTQPTPTSTPAPTPTPTATRTNNIPCGTPSDFIGFSGYPITQSVTLGNPTGNVTLAFSAYSVPDRFIVQWNNNVVIDTGYRGTSNYNFGGAQRAAFNNSLTGRIDPITLNTYPDFVTYPTDGYPLIVGLGAGSASFNKNLANPTSATINVYGPMPDTEWRYIMNCPV
jgi:hypothetical protein